MIALLIASAAAAADPEIVVTASRIPQEETESTASVTVIDGETVERLGDPLASSFLRLTPSAAVETGGPAGALSQVRIRGAEANHTLLFIDGIRANDPASGDIPRFELLNADIISRIEVVRGPQSALWGSDAIGGVVAVNGLPPESGRHSAEIEAGSFGFLRAGVSGALKPRNGSLAGAVGWQRAGGIDSFDGTGDKDGYRNVSARLRGSWNLAPGIEIGAAALSLAGRSQFDGISLSPPFRRTDTLDSNRNRMTGGRLWLGLGDEQGALSGNFSTAYLSSSNRNFIAGEEINRTRGDRWTASAQGELRLWAAGIGHTAIAAVEHEQEDFRARDAIYFGATNQDRERSRQALTLEWRAETGPLIADLALRHDRFSAFADATTVRASALVGLGHGFSVAGGYSEGIAQPTFFDLYGFFPGSFAGNDGLTPERSKGAEASLRYRRGAIAASLTAYRQRLRDEIVDVFDPATFLSTTVNRSTPSRRSGIEAEVAWEFGERLRLGANYAYLDATEPTGPGAVQLREIRRPRQSSAIFGDGRNGRYSYGASLAYVGPRKDTDYDVIPAASVRLGSYWLAGARIGYAVNDRLELFVRGSNLLDARYQDVFGYRTEGRGLFAGLRITGP